MSGVEGLDRVKAALSAYEVALKAEMAKKLPDLGKAMQAELESIAPVSDRTRRGTHLRDLLASADAVKVTPGANPKVEIGFVTPSLQKQGFYALWVHFGRKGYEAGAYRKAGKGKAGKQREQKIKRRIGAMRPTLFFQVAFLRFRDRIRRERAVAKIIAAARTGTGV